MALQRKPKKIDTEAAATAFIEGKPVPIIEPNVIKPSKIAKAVKKPVALRFDTELLSKIDQAATEKGISRNAWISYMCAVGLEKE